MSDEDSTKPNYSRIRMIDPKFKMPKFKKPVVSKPNYVQTLYHKRNVARWVLIMYYYSNAQTYSVNWIIILYSAATDQLIILPLDMIILGHHETLSQKSLLSSCHRIFSYTVIIILIQLLQNEMPKQEDCKITRTQTVWKLYKRKICCKDCTYVWQFEWRNF